MATVDTSIYGRVSKGGNLSDLVNAYDQGVEAKQLSKARELKIKGVELEQAKQAKLSDLTKQHFKNGKLDRAGFLQGLAESNLGTEIPTYEKQLGEADKASAEGRIKQLEAGKKQIDFFRQEMGSLLALPEITDQTLAQAMVSAVRAGYITPEEGAEHMRTLPPDQASRRALLQQNMVATLDASKQLEAMLPKVQAQNLGGHTQMVDTNPLTNPGVVGQQLQRAATPGELEQQRHNQVMEQRQAAQGQREQTQIVTDADGGVHIVNKQTGQSQTATDAQGNPIIGKGGLSQEQLKNASAKKQTVEILRKQLDNLKAARANLGSMDYGVIAGRQGVTDSARAYDGALAALQSTVRQLTRTPGEGAMSDFESRIAMAQLPGRVDPSGVIDQKISQLEDLANIVEKGYSDMLGRSRGGAGAAQPAQAQTGGVLSPQQSTNDQLLNFAKEALKQGVSRDKVIERLRSMGISTEGL